ncbi:NAD-dependent epimerase/dehydratase family protein [Actinomycetota bacterium]
MRTLVCGGTGLLGHEVVRELLARGHEPTVLAMQPPDADLPEQAALPFVGCDLQSATPE